MLNNSQFAHRHDNRSQHQVAVPNKPGPGVSTLNFNKLFLLADIQLRRLRF